jgi:CxC2 like cysteine cluster associated with KDZ transposases
MERTKSRSKRNKKVHIVEGEDDAVNTLVMQRTLIDTVRGQVEVSDAVPMRLDKTLGRVGQSNTAEGSEQITGTSEAAGLGDGAGFDPMVEHNEAGPDGAEIPIPPTPRRRDQTFYMEEFVARVDRLMQAHLSNEARLHDKCGKCNNAIGIWRCKECFLAQPLCRACMRHTHMELPFHRIERWTGTYFEAADLWQVGVYIRLLHLDSTPTCPYLDWQKNILEDFERKNDEDDEVNARAPDEPMEMQDVDDDPHRDTEDDPEADIRFMNHMDHLYREGKDDSETDELTLEEDDDHGVHDPEDDVNFDDMRDSIPFGAAAGPTRPTNTVPDTDALCNKYVRVIHTNGVHHLPLAYCSCAGVDGLPGNLIQAGFMPTSFIRVRTLFTLSVLDQFRYSNLEMKASAHQFFQMLRRITLPMSPNNVINFYHELRRLSRLWRWMKKLKWAGFGHKDADPMNVTSGELSIFCPACPQPGINLPDNWKSDENRWVYRRVLVLDGNFKADHVRQKRAAPDIWLSDGGGMTTRREEYKEFLRTAINRHTVTHFPYIFNDFY